MLVVKIINKIINNFLFVKSKTNMVGYLNYKQPFKNGWLNTGDKVIKSKMVT